MIITPKITEIENYISPKSREFLEKIESITDEIQTLRPLTQDELREMRESFIVSYTYHTNAYKCTRRKHLDSARNKACDRGWNHGWGKTSSINF